MEFLKKIVVLMRPDGSKKETVSGGIMSLFGLAVQHVQAKDYSAARQCLKRALESRREIVDPGLVASMLSLLLLTWLETDQYHEGTEFFSEYISKYPSDASAYAMRANSHWYAGELRAAMEDYSHVLSVNSSDVVALNGRGQVFLELDDFRSATQDLDRALGEVGRLPNVPEEWKTSAKAYALNGLAGAYAGLGDFERALKLFDESMALCPKNAWVYFNRAKAYERRGEIARAREDYKQSLAMKEPKLNVLKREYAEAKVRTL